MKKLEEIIEYSFKDKTLLRQAMTHSSYTSDINENYQRLEFLGDRVLGLCVSKILYKEFPQDVEGNLSQRYMRLVCKETVSEVALTLSLDKFAIVANQEIRTNENVLCDLCEALLGAIFIDSGYDRSFEFVKKHWQELVEKDKTPPKDAKTLLQELAHIHNLDVPKYVLVSREGSEHEPLFHMSVTVSPAGTEVGIGKNKKLAEQMAAEKMILRIESKNE